MMDAKHVEINATFAQNKIGNGSEGWDISYILVYHEKRCQECYSEQWNSKNVRYHLLLNNT
jgi:hypothetical protein